MKQSSILLILLPFLLIFQGQAQIYDDFSGNGFNLSPHWHGDVENFCITPNYELQLNSSSAGNSALWIETDNEGENLEWRFRIKMEFSPSANNFTKFYLLCDSNNLYADAKRAYFLQFGENGSNDAIELFYESPYGNISICRGNNGIIASAFQLDVKVTKDRNNNWQIFISEDLDGNYHLDSYGYSDSTIYYHSIGFLCQYTTSNKNKFIFDDIYFGPPWIDTIAPKIMSIEQGDDYCQVKIKFSEKINRQTALQLSNYTIEESGEIAIACQIVTPSYDEVILTFASKFKNKRLYHLHVENITDNFGNKMENITFPFSFFVIERNEVLIHEIMADPFPTVGLPPVEYVELFNRLDTDLLLSGWHFQYGTTKRLIPDFKIEKKGFAVLVPMASSSQFGNTINIVPLSMLNIVDAGQPLTLFNQYDEIIHYINFSKKWHDPPYKSNGGWSLEMADPDNPCTGKENWKSSCNERGGTPGEENSILTSNPDVTNPKIVKVVVVDSLTIKVFFSETILMNYEKALRLFEEDGDLEIESVEEVPPEHQSLHIRFQQPMRTNTIYTLWLRDTICDCTGLAVHQGEAWQFGLPQKAEKRDLIVNEVLSNPYGNTDADFIEIYNRSDKIIDLKTVRIGSGGTHFPDKSVIICAEGYNLFPKTHLAICKNPSLTASQYICPYPEQLLGNDSLPNFANSSGVVHLTDLTYNEIDKFNYDETMHYALLQSVDGVSLERINYNGETENRNNWKSAAMSAGFATPGYVNSQYSQIIEEDKIITIFPEVFSPDNDGFDDFTQISCSFPESENRVLLQILDEHGNLVKTLANNQICTFKETFIWDGTTDKNRKAPPNLYLVRLQYWNLNGKAKHKHAAVGLVER
ncbi:MAG TPA: lamin tail domain-containing protein [Bacteroidales bacterium]|nr:lamin tail domain-containing protein [Bacteroidales bacterium]